MRAAQRRWRHCNNSHLPGIHLLLIADVASARSKLFLLRYDESRGGKTANIMGPLVPAAVLQPIKRCLGRDRTQQTFLRLFLFRF
jgi:hypothetical protein